LLRPSINRISTFFTVPCISEATKCSTHKSRNFSYFYAYNKSTTKTHNFFSINNKTPDFFFKKKINQKIKRKKKRNLRFPISFSILFLLGDGRIILQNISQSKTHKNKKLIKSNQQREKGIMGTVPALERCDRSQEDQGYHEKKEWLNCQ
jgi:hypothetical protein